MEDLLDLRVTRYADSVLLPRIWQLRHNLSAYDAAYVVLAEKLNATLLTRESALATRCRPCGKHRSVVIHAPEFAFLQVDRETPRDYDEESNGEAQPPRFLGAKTGENRQSKRASFSFALRWQ
jgi:hypothetical protein